MGTDIKDICSKVEWTQDMDAAGNSTGTQTLTVAGCSGDAGVAGNIAELNFNRELGSKFCPEGQIGQSRVYPQITNSPGMMAGKKGNSIFHATASASGLTPKSVQCFDASSVPQDMSAHPDAPELKSLTKDLRTQQEQLEKETKAAKGRKPDPEKDFKNMQIKTDSAVDGLNQRVGPQTEIRVEGAFIQLPEVTIVGGDKQKGTMVIELSKTSCLPGNWDTPEGHAAIKVDLEKGLGRFLETRRISKPNDKVVVTNFTINPDSTANVNPSCLDIKTNNTGPQYQKLAITINKTDIEIHSPTQDGDSK